MQLHNTIDVFCLLSRLNHNSTRSVVDSSFYTRCQPLISSVHCLADAMLSYLLVAPGDRPALTVHMHRWLPQAIFVRLGAPGHDPALTVLRATICDAVLLAQVVFDDSSARVWQITHLNTPP